MPTGGTDFVRNSHKTITIYKNLSGAILGLVVLKSYESLENIGRGVNNTAKIELKNYSLQLMILLDISELLYK